MGILTSTCMRVYVYVFLCNPLYIVDDNNVIFLHDYLIKGKVLNV